MQQQIRHVGIRGAEHKVGIRVEYAVENALCYLGTCGSKACELDIGGGPAHQRHYYKHLKGEETSTNSVATIFAWTGALRKRGELDGIQALQDFADKLEAATIKTIEDGKMTKDLALITTLENPTVLNSENFIKAIRETLEGML